MNLGIKMQQFENQENISQTDKYPQAELPKISKLAIASVVFGMLGPFCAGVVWIVSFNDFLTVDNPVIIGFFSCGAAWILGLAFGIKSLKLICKSKGQLVGREYAMAGIVISAVWMFLVLAALVLPGIYYVNS